MSMTESERLTFQTDVGVSIDKNEDCPTCSICWNCDIKTKDCQYFKDAVQRLLMYEDIGSVEELRELKEKATAKKPKNICADTGLFECPNCGRIQKILYQGFHCKECGQFLDWSEGKE